MVSINQSISKSVWCAWLAKVHVVALNQVRFEDEVNVLHRKALEAILSYFECHGCDHCFPTPTQSQVQQLVSDELLAGKHCMAVHAGTLVSVNQCFRF